MDKMSKGDSQLVEDQGKMPKQNNGSQYEAHQNHNPRECINMAICDFYPTYMKTKCPRMGPRNYLFFSFPSISDVAGAMICNQERVTEGEFSGMPQGSVSGSL